MIDAYKKLITIIVEAIEDFPERFYEVDQQHLGERGHRTRSYIKPYSEVTRQDKQGFRNGEWWFLTKFGGKKPNTWGPVLKEITEVCELKNIQLITEGGPVAVRVIRDKCVTENEGKDET